MTVPPLSAILRNRRIPLALRRALARRIVPFGPASFTVDIGGVAYRGTLDNYIDWMVYVTGDFFEYTYLNFVRGLGLSGLALDVGANVGNHALAFSAMFDEVLAVEPYGPVFQRLERKIADRPNVRIENVGLSDREGAVRFTAPDGTNLGTGSVDDDGDLSVRVVRADDFLHASGARAPTFIKIDVEGHEVPVLRGLRRTLQGARPLVLFEVGGGRRETRRRRLREACGLFPGEYSFTGFVGQTTFPVQRDVARGYPLATDRRPRRYTYVLACPDEFRAHRPITHRFRSRK